MDAKSGKVTVISGSGFIGGAIVRSLRDAGFHNVHTAGRSTGVDVTRPDTLATCLQGTATLIQSLQFPSHPVEIPRRGWTYELIDAQGTESLVVAARTAGIKLYVYLSGAGVRPGRREAWFTAKYRAEEAIRSSSIPYIIFRPSWVYGPADRSLNKFVNFVRHLPFFPMIGNGRETVAPVYVEDLARVVVRALDEPRALNQVFELGGPDELSMRQIVQIIVRVLGVRRPYPIVPIPKWSMKIVASLLEFLPTPPLSRGAVEFVTMQETVSDSRARDILGWNPRSLDAALRTYLNARGRHRDGGT